MQRPTSKPCNAQERIQPREQSLQGSKHSQPLVSGQNTNEMQKFITVTREALQISCCHQSAKAGLNPSPCLGSPAGQCQDHSCPSHSVSVPCPNGLGAQPGPQGAAVAWGVLPRQSRGYGSGSLRHLEKKGDICRHLLCPTTAGGRLRI